MCYQDLQGERLTNTQIARLSDRNWLRTNARRIYKDKINLLAEIDLEINGISQPVVIKWFGWRNRISYWLSPVMRSRAKKSWDAALNLLRNGIQTPAPLTVYTLRRCGFIRCNFLLTKKVGNYTLARRWLRDENATNDEKITIVETIAVMIGKMHQSGLVHYDLTPGNFLVSNDNPANVILIDLNRMKRRIVLSRRLKMYDIAKLNLCTCGLNKEHASCLWSIFLEKYDQTNFAQNRIALRSAIRRRKIHHSVKSMRKPSNHKNTQLF
ncbi:MAG: lipopolysaccharide kinase InaA family protein [Candidatus Marinimicrobia bacterium]|nr:lipopolysaccharide kinase InaA family protein [Candidatus Neomarinimicrobiota bacterium]